MQIQATIPNPKHLLLPGMYANAMVDVGEKETLSDAAADRDHLQPLRLHCIHRDTGCAEENAPGAPTQAQGGLEVQQAFVTTGDTRGDQVAIPAD